MSWRQFLNSNPLIQGVPQCHESGDLIFYDEFDEIDLDMWDHEITMAGGGNWEFQVYWNNRSNSYTRNTDQDINKRFKALKIFMSKATKNINPKLPCSFFILALSFLTLSP